MTMMSVLTLVSGKEDRTLRRIRVSEIARNPNQPRKYFDPEAIAQLAESIRQYGVLNPLTVRRAPGGGYELVAGERRLRAARVAGLNDVPCLLIAADNEDSSAIALVENLQRRDLDFFEEAYGFKRLIDQYGLTQEEAARKVGKTQSAVANKLFHVKQNPPSCVTKVFHVKHQLFACGILIVSVIPSSFSCRSTVAPIPASTITPTARLSVFRKNRTSLISRTTLSLCGGSANSGCFFCSSRF